MAAGWLARIHTNNKRVIHTARVVCLCPYTQRAVVTVRWCGVGTATEWTRRRAHSVNKYKELQLIKMPVHCLGRACGVASVWVNGERAVYQHGNWLLEWVSVAFIAELGNSSGFFVKRLMKMSSTSGEYAKITDTDNVFIDGLQKSTHNIRHRHPIRSLYSAVLRVCERAIPLNIDCACLAFLFSLSFSVSLRTHTHTHSVVCVCLCLYIFTESDWRWCRYSF